jgi:hypothetical protein
MPETAFAVHSFAASSAPIGTSIARKHFTLHEQRPLRLRHSALRLQGLPVFRSNDQMRLEFLAHT